MIRLLLVERYGDVTFEAQNEEAEEFVKDNAMGFELVTRTMFAERYRLRHATPPVLRSLCDDVKVKLIKHWPHKYFHVSIEIRKDLLPHAPVIFRSGIIRGR